jgi:hypothetical protein
LDWGALRETGNCEYLYHEEGTETFHASFVTSLFPHLKKLMGPVIKRYSWLTILRDMQLMPKMLWLSQE